MRLTDASVAIRPRSAWEALDLGILLAHRHARLLMGSWALLTLPLFAVLSLLLWQHPTLAILIFWWLKPAFERLPLYILARPVRRYANPEAGPARLSRPAEEAVAGQPAVAPLQSDAQLRPAGPATGRARRGARSQRLIVLSQRNAGGATWLTVVGVHLEMALWAGFAMLLYLLIPAQNEIDWNWQSLLDPEAGEWLWLEHLSNLLYVLVLVVWGADLRGLRLHPLPEPAHRTGGLGHRAGVPPPAPASGRQRLCPAARPGRFAGLAARPFRLRRAGGRHQRRRSRAAARAGPPAAAETQQRTGRQADPGDRRRRAVQEQRDRYGLALRRQDREKDSRKEDEERLKAFFEALANWVPFRHAAQVIEVLLWALLFSAVFLLVWRYREWLRLFVGNLGLPQRARREAPTVMFGLDLSPESLPDDIAGNAERLWNENHGKPSACSTAGCSADCCMTTACR